MAWVAAHVMTGGKVVIALLVLQVWPHCTSLKLREVPLARIAHAVFQLRLLAVLRTHRAGADGESWWANHGWCRCCCCSSAAANARLCPGGSDGTLSPGGGTITIIITIAMVIIMVETLTDGTSAAAPRPPPSAATRAPRGTIGCSSLRWGWVEGAYYSFVL